MVTASIFACHISSADIKDENRFHLKSFDCEFTIINIEQHLTIFWPTFFNKYTISLQLRSLIYLYLKQLFNIA